MGSIAIRRQSTEPFSFDDMGDGLPMMSDTIIMLDGVRTMDERQEIKRYLLEVIGEEGCGAACDESDVYYDDEGWKLNMCSFMEPWKLGKTVEEAKATLKELGSMGSGLS